MTIHPCSPSGFLATTSSLFAAAPQVCLRLIKNVHALFILTATARQSMDFRDGQVRCNL
jgi:hypothetical protein